MNLLLELPRTALAGHTLRQRLLTSVSAFGWVIADDDALARRHTEFCRAIDDYRVNLERPTTGIALFPGSMFLCAEDSVWFALDARLAASGWFDPDALAEAGPLPGGGHRVEVELRSDVARRIGSLVAAVQDHPASAEQRALDVLYASADLLQTVPGPLALDMNGTPLGPEAWWVSIDPATEQVVRCIALQIAGATMAVVAELDPGLVHAVVSEPIAGSFSAWAFGDALVAPTPAIVANARFLIACIDQHPASPLADRLLGLIQGLLASRPAGTYTGAVAGRVAGRDSAGLVISADWSKTLGVALLDRLLAYRAHEAVKLDRFDRDGDSDGGVALARTLDPIAVADDVIGRSW